MTSGPPLPSGGADRPAASGVTSAGAAATARASRKRTAAAVLLSGVLFAAGAATGWGVSRFAPPHGPPGPAGMAGEPPIDRLVAHMREELLLSREQAERITAIYEERLAAIRAIREENAPRFKAEYDRLREQVQGVLRPEQFARWDERFAAVRDRMLPPPPRDRRPPPPGTGFDGREGRREEAPDVGGPPDGEPPGRGPGGGRPPRPPERRGSGEPDEFGPPSRGRPEGPPRGRMGPPPEGAEDAGGWRGRPPTDGVGPPLR